MVANKSKTGVKHTSHTSIKTVEMSMKSRNDLCTQTKTFKLRFRPKNQTSRDDVVVRDDQDDKLLMILMTGVVTNGPKKVGASRCASVQRSSSHATTNENSAAVRNNCKQSQESREEVGLSLLLPFTCNTCSTAHTHTSSWEWVGGWRIERERGGSYHPLPVGDMLSQSYSISTTTPGGKNWEKVKEEKSGR